jgi:DNA-binding NarL/FixJ family response regulator
MKICVVDPHEIVRIGLVTLLNEKSGWDVVGVAATGEQAKHLVLDLEPDVVLTEWRLPDMTADLLCRSVAATTGSAVVIFSAHLSEDVVERAVRAGARGFVTKEAGAAELRDVVSRVAAAPDGQSWGAPSAIVQRLYDVAVTQGAGRRLTPRQERILELIAVGLTYAEISSRLHLSESTVRFHIQGLKARLGVRTTAELIAFAIRSALIAPECSAALA